MSLIVEDGTGLRTAESYVSVADADTYHGNMGNVAWAGTVTQKEIALRQATQYIDATYWFRGQRMNYFQSLRWPRIDAGRLVWYQGWPPRVLVQATAEMAMRFLVDPTNTGLIDVTDQAVLEEHVGPVSVKYGPQVRAGQKRYILIDNLLKILTTGSTASVRIELG